MPDIDFYINEECGSVTISEAEYLQITSEIFKPFESLPTPSHARRREFEKHYMAVLATHGIV